MDEFEKKYASGEGDVFFRDKIPIPKWFLGLAAFAPIGMGGMMIAMGFPILNAVAIAVGAGLFGFLGNVALMGVRIVVSDAGVDVHVGIRRRHFDFSDIVRTEQAEYRIRDYPLGRGSIKFNLSGDRAFIGDLGIKRGVKLHLKSGRHVFITSNDPAGLEQAIARATSPKTGVRVHDTADEPAVAEEEVALAEDEDKQAASGG